MKLTRHTDYSLRALMYLAANQERRVTVSEIAQHHRISRNHIVKVVHQLGVLGYVMTLRGKHGGVTLARPATEILVGQVVQDMEPGMALVECLESNSDCILTPQCRLKDSIRQATAAFLATLNSVSLNDLVNSPTLVSLRDPLVLDSDQAQ